MISARAKGCFLTHFVCSGRQKQRLVKVKHRKTLTENSHLLGFRFSLSFALRDFRIARTEEDLQVNAIF